MTEHRGVTTVMGYFQAGNLLTSRVTTLLAMPVAIDRPMSTSTNVD
jgi:hypothetical protein